VVSKHVVLLVGPKGAGKSTLGRLLARTYGYTHVEPGALWIEHAARRPSYPDESSYEREGFARVAAAVAAALASHDVAVTDTTGASDETPCFVEELARLGTVHAIRLLASEETCRARIERRDGVLHLPAAAELVARAYAQSMWANVPASSVGLLDVGSDLPSPVYSLPGLHSALTAMGVPARASAPILRTERTLLRGWRDEDRAPFAAMNADPEVMEHMVSVLSAAESDAQIALLTESFEIFGFSAWALEVPDRLPLAGFCGLWSVGFEASFTPAVEIVWRLSRDAWGHGYVTESARAVLAHAFEVIELPEVVAYTTVANRRSRAVMERLGFARDEGGDFDHPDVPEGHRVRRHVLYRLSRDAWRSRASAG
jgi:RimJ/RimL family protein N-acetyltransferase/shikimate kinase